MHDTDYIGIINKSQPRRRQPKYKTEAERIEARRASKKKSRQKPQAKEKAREATKRYRQQQKAKIAAAERANTVSGRSASASPGTQTSLPRITTDDRDQNSESSLLGSSLGDEVVGQGGEQNAPPFTLSTGAVRILRSFLQTNFDVTVEDVLWDELEPSEESCRVVVERCLQAKGDPARHCEGAPETMDRISARLCVLEGLRGLERYEEVRRCNQVSATVKEEIADRWEAEQQELDAKLARLSLSLQVFSQHDNNEQNESGRWVSYQFIKVICDITRQRSKGLSFEIELLRRHGASKYMAVYKSFSLPWQQVSDNEGETVTFAIG
ncbi:hypothetical protein FRC00_010018 [Tulasnella sp. 408]|nr:hypothetical protein FRC00_010018 [Tulasnella sp. 408]